MRLHHESLSTGLDRRRVDPGGVGEILREATMTRAEIEAIVRKEFAGVWWNKAMYIAIAIHDVALEQAAEMVPPTYSKLIRAAKVNSNGQ